MQRPSETLNTVFRRHYQELVCWCRKRVPPHLGEPEDFVHSAYLRCSGHWSADRNSESGERAYLYRALRWVVIDAIRVWRREKVGDQRATVQGTGRRWGVLHELAVREAVMGLSGKELQVCSARLAGKNDAQTRHELNLTPGALAVHICRLKANLCRLLGVRNGQLARRASGRCP